MEWNKVEVEEYEQKESKVIKFDEEGDELVGIYRGYVEYENDKGQGKFYKFEDVDDSELEYICFGGLAVLDDRMNKVPIDAPTKIVYKGKKQSKKNKSRYFKDFEVFIGA